LSLVFCFPRLAHCKLTIPSLFLSICRSDTSTGHRHRLTFSPEESHHGIKSDPPFLTSKLNKQNVVIGPSSTIPSQIMEPAPVDRVESVRVDRVAMTSTSAPSIEDANAMVLEKAIQVELSTSPAIFEAPALTSKQLAPPQLQVGAFHHTGARTSLNSRVAFSVVDDNASANSKTADGTIDGLAKEIGVMSCRLLLMLRRSINRPSRQTMLAQRAFILQVHSKMVCSDKTCCLRLSPTTRMTTT